MVERAANEVNMTVQSCYRLRRSPDGRNFAAAWDVALSHAARVLLDTAFERAFNGTDEPVFDRTGRRVGRRMRQNDRLIMFLLRAYMPERFRYAHRDACAPGEALPPPALPMEPALLRIAPGEPAAPHLLMDAQTLANKLEIADIMTPGILPHFHRGVGDTEQRGIVPSKEFDEMMDKMIHGDRNAPRSDYGPEYRDERARR